MLKVLVVLLYLIGIGVILGITALLAKRSAGAPVPDTAPLNGHHPADAAVGRRSARSSIIGMLLIVAAGAAVVFALVCLLGLLVVHAAPGVDKTIYNWIIHHRVHSWASVMNRLTKFGDTWTTWGATVAAAVCLAALCRRDKWLPPVALGAAIVVDHYVTQALRHTFHRLGPPDSPLGTFPSGGCDRVILLYGLIAYLIWREVSGTRRGAIWSAGAVALLAFNEGYSRAYLTLHWTSDIISGLIYGTLLLIVFIATIRLVVGPARARGPEREGTPVRLAPALGEHAPTAQ
jgi:membrane-associated phospholipid phosphatase